MGCRNDYMNPTEQEIESKKVAEHLVYVASKLGKTCKDYVIKASNTMYGDESKIDEMTVTLCNLLKSLSEEQTNKIVYYARSKQSRDLADWWENHQEFDKKRIEQEKEEKRLKEVKVAALAKLSPMEKRALGIQ